MLLTLENSLKIRGKKMSKCYGAFGSWDYRQIFFLIFLYLIYFPKFLLGACIAVIRNNSVSSETLTLLYYKYLHLFVH